MITRIVFLLLTGIAFISAQQPGIEKYGQDFKFLPENLGGISRLSTRWLTSQHVLTFPEGDSTVSKARWQSGDYSLSDVHVLFSPASLHNRWILAGQWLTYEGYSRLDRNDFLAGYHNDEHTLSISVVNIKPEIYEPVPNRFTRWEARTQSLNWNMKKTKGSVDVKSALSGKYSRFKPDRGDSLLAGNTRYAELTGRVSLQKNGWSVMLDGEWYESWLGEDHFRFSQVNLVPVFYHHFGEVGFTLSSNNETVFGYDGWVVFSQWGLKAEFALEARFYPAVLITRYGAGSEADFLSARFFLNKSFGEYIRLKAKHGWSKRLDQTYYLSLNTNTMRINALTGESAMLMHGDGTLEIGGKSLMADITWNYRDFNGFEYLWYHPGRINIQSGFQLGITFFRNLNLMMRMEGLWQIHDVPQSMWFVPELPGYVPIIGYSGAAASDWTLNGKISARVKTFVLTAGIENILQKEVYTAQNLMPNSRMFILDIEWLWYQ